jgi:hypothetical protein
MNRHIDKILARVGARRAVRIADSLALYADRHIGDLYESATCPGLWRLDAGEIHDVVMADTLDDAVRRFAEEGR